MARATGAPVIGGLRGKFGTAVLIPTVDGMIMRALVVPENPRTPLQMVARARQTKVARAWAGLSLEADARWREYAQGLAAPSPRTGLTVAPRADNVFGGLYSRMLLVDPAALPPQAPPVGTFFGDTIEVSVIGGAVGAGFGASGANAPGVVTELLLQPLANAKRRRYLEKYRHAALTTFVAGHLVQEVPLAPGWYAGAYRFVKAATGQATGLAEIGAFQVGGPV